MTQVIQCCSGPQVRSQNLHLHALSYGNCQEAIAQFNKLQEAVLQEAVSVSESASFICLIKLISKHLKILFKSDRTDQNMSLRLRKYLLEEIFLRKCAIQ